VEDRIPDVMHRSRERSQEGIGRHIENSRGSMGKKMSTIICTSCGRETRTTLSEEKESGVIHCFAAFEKGHWEKGCGFEKALGHEQELVEELIQKYGKE